eukprot:1009252-Prymnesium_polylepis.1
MATREHTCARLLALLVVCFLVARLRRIMATALKFERHARLAFHRVTGNAADLHALVAAASEGEGNMLLTRLWRIATAVAVQMFARVMAKKDSRVAQTCTMQAWLRMAPAYLTLMLPAIHQGTAWHWAGDRLAGPVTYNSCSVRRSEVANGC